MTRKPRNIVGRFLKRSSLPLILVLFGLFLGGFFWWTWGTTPVSPGSARTIALVIPKGEGLSSIAWLLRQAGLIRSPLTFKLLVLSQGLVGSIQAGRFELSPASTPEEIVQQLIHGTSDIWLTFPEGWRKEEFRQRLDSNLENFHLGGFNKLSTDKEGYLFPDTYLIPKDASASAIVKMLTDNFEKKFNSDLQKAANSAGITKEQVVILASIVERETKKDEDRKLVAGILIKRWKADWPLQADATVQYAKINDIVERIELASWEGFDWWPAVGKEDLQIDSPYNTYRYKGLPPAPICNPGLASIEAVVYPEQTPYWFYLSDSGGQIHYAETSELHHANIVRFLR